jgi:hypothetical protein
VARVVVLARFVAAALAAAGLRAAFAAAFGALDEVGAVGI